MSEPYSLQVMPQSVSFARICMWVQAVLGLAGLFLLLILLGSAPAGGALAASLVLPLVTILLIGFLAMRVFSRRRWVRVCGLIAESLLVLGGVWQLGSGVSFGNVLGLLLAALVFAQLCRSTSALWFDR